MQDIHFAFSDVLQHAEAGEVTNNTCMLNNAERRGRRPVVYIATTMLERDAQCLVTLL